MKIIFNNLNYSIYKHISILIFSISHYPIINDANSNVYIINANCCLTNDIK